MVSDNKKKQGSSGSSNNNNNANLDIKSEEVLQAIVLGDSFDRKFAPITLEKPRTLLPLVNIPLLDYTLELLASGGIQEIFVFCCAHAEQIKQYISQSRWSKLPGVIVKAIVGSNCQSTGDALRAIFQCQLIQSDFVLISGDVVSNMNLAKALQVHKARRELDKNNILTMVFKQASPSHRTRSKQDDPVIGIDHDTLQLLCYENSVRENKIKLSTKMFKKHPSIQLRYDLIDCHIDICSPEVLALFNDNFDFEDIRKDFIHDLMASDLLDHRIYTYVLQGEYAARVKDLRTYHSVSKDIIHRWTFPMVPDNNFMCNTTYSLSRQMIYKEKGVKLLSDCVVGEETVLGHGTQIGGGSDISHSIIGRNCIIGNNVKIVGSYIWDNVIIEDDVIITSSMICDGAHINANSTVSKGSIISFNVVVGDALFVDQFSKLTICDPEAGDDEIDDPTAEIPMGKNGVGRKWLPKNEHYNELVPRDIEPDEEGTTEVGIGEDPPETKTPGAIDDPNNEMIPDSIKFMREVKATILRGSKDKHEIEYILLEINSLKYAYDRDGLNCLFAVTAALLELPNLSTISQKELVTTIKTNIKTYAKILGKFSGNEETIQIDYIFKIQDICDDNPPLKEAFQFILHSLYENEVVGEEAILGWADETAEDEEEDQFYLKKYTPAPSFVRTKIVCTIGPKTMSEDSLVKLIETGMNICRLNFSHGTHEYHGQVIKNLRAAVERTGKVCAIMLDTKGPEIRTGKLEGPGYLDLAVGQEIIVDTNNTSPGNASRISIDYKGLVDSVHVGGYILIADGVISLSIINVNKEQRNVLCRVNNNARLGETKNVHLPGAIVNLPAVSEKDIDDIKFGIEQKVDFIAASFIRKPEDVLEIKSIIGEEGCKYIQIISKIENQEGVDNFNEILEVSDGIMVARGDLGVEVKMEKIFVAQKMMVSKCNAAGKPVITATQMLESMIKAPRPTRAEATDVANAVLDGTDCVMLSGETASGDYPFEAVDMMAKICREGELVESSTDYQTLFAALKLSTAKPITIAETVASYAVATAIDLKADLILTLTETGLTTRLVSKYRPPIPIFAVTSWPYTVKHLMATRGTIPILVESLIGTDKLVEHCLDYALAHGLCKTGSRIVIVSGVMEGVPGKTNSLRVLTVGETIKNIKV
eukprot:gene1071-1357_t